MIIFFDIDETLVDHAGAEHDAVIAFYREHAALFSERAEEFAQRWHQVAETHMQRYLTGELSFQAQRRVRVKEVFKGADIPLTDSRADALFASYLKHYENHWRLFPDVEACFRMLSSHQLGIISNGDTSQQRKKLNDLGIASFFTSVTISSDVGVAKPEPGIFIEACRQAQLPPETCVYIGDRLETDARAAVKAGLRGIWLNRSGLPRVNIDVPVITSLDELPPLIDGRTKSQ